MFSLYSSLNPHLFFNSLEEEKKKFIWPFVISSFLKFTAPEFLWVKLCLLVQDTI